MALNRNSTRSIAIDKGIAEFIIKDMESLSVVDGEGFRNLLNILEPCYQLPSRPHIHNKYIIPMYHSTVEHVKTVLGNAERYSLTTDGWSSLANDSYISLTCHFIDKYSFTLESVLLNTTHMPEAHTGEHLLSELESLIRFWNLDSNMKPFFVTENNKNKTNA